MTYMPLLIVSSTLFEIAPLLNHLGITYSPSEHHSAGTILSTDSVDCLITGVGAMSCGVHLARCLAERRCREDPYAGVLQAGLAGSFRPEFGKGTVVLVESEALSDLGAEDHGSFLDLHEMGLLGRDEPPFTDGRLTIAPCSELFARDLPRVRSVTVNRVLSEERSIAWVKERYAPDIVNMEGAALFYTCLLEKVPFISIRAVSDQVGPRDKESWDIPGSIRALNDRLIALLPELIGSWGPREPSLRDPDER